MIQPKKNYEHDHYLCDDLAIFFYERDNYLCDDLAKFVYERDMKSSNGFSFDDFSSFPIFNQSYENQENMRIGLCNEACQLTKECVPTTTSSS